METRNPHVDSKWSLVGMQSHNFSSKTRSIVESLSNKVDKGLVSNYSSETDSVHKHWPVVEFSLPACQNIYGKQDDNRFKHLNCHFETSRWKVL